MAVSAPSLLINPTHFLMHRDVGMAVPDSKRTRCTNGSIQARQAQGVTCYLIRKAEIDDLILLSLHKKTFSKNVEGCI